MKNLFSRFGNKLRYKAAKSLVPGLVKTPTEILNEASYSKDIRLPESAAEDLRKTLPLNPITHVSIYGKSLRHEAVISISEGLKDNSGMIYLTMNGCGLTNQTMGIIMDSIEGHNIESLSLGGNSFDAESFSDKLSKHLQKNKKLSELNLRNSSKIDDEGVAHIMGAIAGSSLKVLDLRDCDITYEGAELILAALKGNKTISNIKLKGNFISTEMRCAIWAQLELNTSKSKGESWHISMYDLEEIDGEGMDHIIIALRSRGVKSLKIDNNIKLTPEAINKLAMFIKEIKNTTLESLDLSYHSLGPDNIKTLAKALKSNHSIVSINLSGNDIDDEALGYLIDAIKANPRIKAINLSHNKISDEGIKALTNALEGRTDPLYMNFSLNQIGDYGFKALKASMEKHPNLVLGTISELDYSPSPSQRDANKCALANKARFNKQSTQLRSCLASIGLTSVLTYAIASSAFIPLVGSFTVAILGGLATYHFLEGKNKEEPPLAKE